MDNFNNINKINELRQSLNDIDKLIVSNILERLDLVKLIHKIKINNNLKIIDIEQENKILKEITCNIADSEVKNIIINIYRRIFQEVKTISYTQDTNILDDINKYINNNKLIIAGPCSVESKEQIEQIAIKVKEFGVKFLRGGIFKARTNPDSFQGLQEKGLEIFYNAAKDNGLYTVSEFLDIEQAKDYYEYFDVILIGSRNMTNFEFLRKIGKLTAKNQKPVILKRGFGSTIDEFISASKYITNEGNPNVILCLRGIRTFESASSFWRFPPDFTSIIEIKSKSDLPVIFDPSHSAGRRNLVPSLSQAAMQIGFNGLIIEAHQFPEKALSDAEQTIELDVLHNILKTINYYVV
jgi:3-deoxy-7-phosphoheptulonate synthase